MDFWDLKGQDFGNQFEATEFELLEKKVRANPRNHEDQEKLLTSYQKCGKLEKLREARTEMAKFLLVSPRTWNNWMEEELLAEEYELYDQLFEISIQHYADPKMWLARLQRVNKTVVDDDGDLDMDAVEIARETCEQAIKMCGHFVVGGSDIWQIYRNLENTILSKSLTNIDDDDNMDDEEVPEEAKLQIQKVKELYCRQFEVPLYNLDQVYDEFNEWHTLMCGVVSHEMKETYLKTFKYMKSVRAHETAILEEAKDSIEERRELWTEYIRGQIKLKSDIPRVQSLFERAVMDCCDEPGDLWTQYAEYALQFNLINRYEVCLRSTKRHPESGKLWSYFLTAAGKDQASLNEVLEIWKAITSCNISNGRLELCFALVSYFREFAPETIQEGVQRAEKLLQEESDEVRSKFYQFWGQVACVSLKDVELTRKAYENFRRCTKKLASHWLQSVDALVSFGDVPGARSLFRHSFRVLSAEDGFYELSDRWLLFERIHGGKEEFFDAKGKLANQKVKVQAEQERKKSMMKGKSKKRRLEEAALAAKKRAKLNSGKTIEKAEASTDVNMSSTTDADAPPGFNETDAPPGFNEDNGPPGFADDAPPGFGDSAPPGFNDKATDAPPGFEDTEKSEPAEAAEETKMQTRTIFVLNIPKALRYEQELEKMCREFGEVKSVRCPRGQKGKVLKGFGYVEFENAEDASKALLGMKGKNLGKKTLQIQKYRKASAHHSLFIKGIKKLKNPSFQLKKLFESCGNIVEIRVPLDNTKRNKGFAYVEFEKAKGVEQALKIENPTIEGYTLGVQKCRDKKKAAKDLPKQFVPRTLNKSKKKALGGSKSEAKDSKAEAPTASNIKPKATESSGKSLSNSDFRKFLS